MRVFVFLLLLLKTEDDLSAVALKPKVDLKHKTYLVLKNSSQSRLNNYSNSSGKDARIDDLISLTAKARSFGIYLIYQI